MLMASRFGATVEFMRIEGAPTLGDIGSFLTLGPIECLIAGAFSKRALSRPSPQAAGNDRNASDLGVLPQWRLDDLYEGMDSPRFAADLKRAAADARSFAAAYQGKLAELAKAADAGERLVRGGSRL